VIKHNFDQLKFDQVIVFHSIRFCRVGVNWSNHDCLNRHFFQNCECSTQKIGTARIVVKIFATVKYKSSIFSYRGSQYLLAFYLLYMGITLLIQPNCHTCTPFSLLPNLTVIHVHHFLYYLT
jgi:hypothetical protein